MKVQILTVTIEFWTQPFLRPLQLSSGMVSTITEARASVTVSVNGRKGVGLGSIYLSDLWAWPEPSLTHEQRDKVLRAYCVAIAQDLPGIAGEAAHPLQLGLRLHEHLHRTDIDCTGVSLPLLARAMCSSPFDAAIHDAVGQTLGISSLDFYNQPSPIPSADQYFPEGACQAIQGVLTAPRKELDAWLTVGANDNLEADVAPWIRERGYRCFKLKLLGKDSAADAARTVEVFRAVQNFGAREPRLSVDSNEANPDAASVLDYLGRLQASDKAAFAALEYLEQPTARDITQAAYDWREVTKLKPVFLDEGLTSLELLETAKEQGWSGLAIKTCKGHSLSLIAAAWAHQNQMLLTMQDLTNPGLAAIHSALLAAHLPTINGIELNSPQYTPAANAPWLPRLHTLLEPQDGVHRLGNPHPVGLGSQL